MTHFCHTNNNSNSNSNKTQFLRYVSIHSEDRNMLKYPSSSAFSIELPDDILNVKSIRLSEWAFPSNYNTFSKIRKNIQMSFKIKDPYYPKNISAEDKDFMYQIYQILYSTKSQEYVIEISEGFYDPIQMATELTNRFNEAVTKRLREYFKSNDEMLDKLKHQEYNDFIITYNEVKQKIFFGNRKDQFTLTNSTLFDEPYLNELKYNEFSNWGLPSHLGLQMCDEEAEMETDENTPRFYHLEGDLGYWLPPSGHKDSKVSWIEPKQKINLMGYSHFYMEIGGINCMDETSPYVLNDFTMSTNSTNGRVRSAFAKIPVPSTPVSQYFDKDASSYMIFKPIKDRLRKLNIKLRYHNGELVDFGSFQYSFTLECHVEI